MPKTLQFRRGTTAELSTVCGSVAELFVDTSKNTVVLMDGSTAGGITVGNLQGNIQLGKTGANEIDTSSGNLTIDSAGGTVTVDDNLIISGDLTVQGTTTTVNSTVIDVQNSLRFEGATSDAFETNLTVTDPTADRTITLPNATGYVPVFATQPTSAITDGCAGQFLTTNGCGALSFSTINTGLEFDGNPKLGGNLDLNFKNIVGNGDIGFTGNLYVTGTMVLNCNPVAYRTRTVAESDGVCISINADCADMVTQDNTQCPGTLTINAPTGCFYDGQRIMLRVKSASTQTLSFNAVYDGSDDLTLPTSTSGSSKTDYLGFAYNNTSCKWEFVGKIFGF